MFFLFNELIENTDEEAEVSAISHSEYVEGFGWVKSTWQNKAESRK